jgi:hypothetical protein
MAVPILDSARAGYVTPIWSPAIITEANCVLTRLWIQRHGGVWTPELEREHSRAVHTWFRYMTAVFRVVDDCPPAESMWSTTPRDPDDTPLWTAAVRARTDFVVTENLQDGPPPDAAGRRRYVGITYVHPVTFIAILQLWASFMDTGQHPTSEELAGDTRSLAETVTQPPSLATAPPPVKYIEDIWPEHQIAATEHPSGSAD